MNTARMSVLLVVVAAMLASCTSTDDPQQQSVVLTIGDNSEIGGRNAQSAAWTVEYVIPRFEDLMEEQGRDVEVEFQSGGIEDEDYKRNLILEIQAGGGPDVLVFDQFWLAEMAAADVLRPLTDVVGPHINQWEGWDHIPLAVRSGLEFEGRRFGIPLGTDGRVLFYNSGLFKKAGLPGTWKPRSWQDVISTAESIKRSLPGVVPLQINAGVSMGEATTLQGFMPLLLGTGASIYNETTGKWLGDTPELRQALDFYARIYSSKLADADLQIDPDGRDLTFELFSRGRIAILAESDYLYRAVINPHVQSQFPMRNRDAVVRWTKMPARAPGRGIRGQDFVSASGGGGASVNPNTDHAELAWELLTFMNSRDSFVDLLKREPRLVAREDVNALDVVDDPLLSFIGDEILPITWFRPGFPEYTDVSMEITHVVESVATGDRSVEDAAERWQRRLESIVGPENVESRR